MIYKDLHIHSRFSSDGEFSVAEIIHRCQAQKINTFSITDHNSIKATSEALQLAQQAELHFIPGIELDCQHQGTNLHLLGYQIDWRSADFARVEEEVAAKVMASFSEMIANLNRLGFIIDAATVLAHAEGHLPTGELIAAVMLSDKKYHTPPLRPYMTGGARADMPQINFYLDFFAQGKPAFVPISYMSYRDAIALIKDHGGIPIVAHPGLNFKGRERVVETLMTQGAAGLEVFNNYHHVAQINYFTTQVQQSGGLMTCGSDFHGHTKPLINIGQFQIERQFEDYVNQSIQQIQSATI
ncbi:MAG: PHP domain-containing protein [Alistipes sp.]